MGCDNIDRALEGAGLGGDSAPYLEQLPYGCPAGCVGVDAFGPGPTLAIAAGATADVVVQPQNRCQIERPWFDSVVTDNFVLTRFMIGSENMLLADSDMPLACWSELARSKPLRRVDCAPNTRVLMTVKNITAAAADFEVGYTAFRLPPAGSPCAAPVGPARAAMPYGCPSGCHGMHYFGCNSTAAIAAGAVADVIVQPQKMSQVERPWLTLTMARNFRLLSFKIGSDNILSADTSMPFTPWTDLARSLPVRRVRAAANTNVTMRVQNITAGALTFRAAYSAYLLEAA